MTGCESRVGWNELDALYTGGGVLVSGCTCDARSVPVQYNQQAG